MAAPSYLAYSASLKRPAWACKSTKANIDVYFLDNPVHYRIAACQLSWGPYMHAAQKLAENLGPYIPGAAAPDALMSGSGLEGCLPRTCSHLKRLGARARLENTGVGNLQESLLCCRSHLPALKAADMCLVHSWRASLPDAQDLALLANHVEPAMGTCPVMPIHGFTLRALRLNGSKCSCRIASIRRHTKRFALLLNKCLITMSSSPDIQNAAENIPEKHMHASTATRHQKMWHGMPLDEWTSETGNVISLCVTVVSIHDRRQHS
jgi:hypothetical protein